MNKFIGSKWIKLVAILLFAICVASFALGAVGILFANDITDKRYDSYTVRKTLYDNRAKMNALFILQDIAEDDKLDNLPDIDGMNILILQREYLLSSDTIMEGRYHAGNCVYGSLGGNDATGYVCGQSGWKFTIVARGLDVIPPSCMVETNDQPLHYTFFDEDNAYATDIVLDSDNYYDYDTAAGMMGDRTVKYYVIYSVDYNAGKGTMFEDSKQCADYILWSAHYGFMVMGIAGLIGICCLAYLIVASKKTISIDNKIPYLLLAAVAGVLEGSCLIALLSLEDSFISFALIFVLFIGLAMMASLIFVYFVMNTVTRFKAHCFVRYTLLHYLLYPLKGLFMVIRDNLSLTAKGILFTTVLGVVQIIGLAVGFTEFSLEVFLFLIYKTFETALIIWIVIQYDRVKKGMEKVAAGEEVNIDRSFMLHSFKTHADNIIDVGHGINTAIDERTKSERMKTELITNVSHDIKTPLTSIINYIDLLQKEDNTPEKNAEYLEVLSRQSTRLKKLIEDLIEASKASSGAIEMNLESVNISVLLSQATGEFEEKLMRKKLSLFVSSPEEEQQVQADGRYLWRVIDNLMSNICKYSMENTRVYVDLIPEEEEVKLVFKNISSQKLNITPEELTERFVRGDKSRNTEGSGLGLSIAKSLTELMGGRLDIAIDADLFKVTLTFPKTQQIVPEQTLS